MSRHKTAAEIILERAGLTGPPVPPVQALPPGEVLEMLRSLLAEKGGKVAYRRSLEDDAVRGLAVGWLECRLEVERYFADLCKGDHAATKGDVDKQLRRNVRSLAAIIQKDHERSRQLDAAKDAGASADRNRISNYTIQLIDKDGEQVARRVGVPAQQIHAQITAVANGWPNRVGTSLFALDAVKGGPMWLPSTADLLGWLAGLLPADGENALDWAGGHGMLTRDEFHGYLRHHARHWDAVETMPHEPPYPAHCYLLTGKPLDTQGVALRGLVDRFCPATDADYHLITAFFLSLFWGGEPGSRPAWLFTATDDDLEKGRGVGKSTVAKMAARLLGGFLSARKNEDMGDLLKRLLSEDGLKTRLLLLDNLKTLKLSWDDLEALITMPTLSGHRMYYGEGTRPNTLTIALTINGAALSKDLAQRCVIVMMDRPEYSATWEDETFAYIERHRWEIVGDCLAMLAAEPRPLERFSRWGAWERGVLSRTPDPANTQQVILDRQASVDEDDTEDEIIRTYFARALAAHGHSPDRERVFIPSRVAGAWCNEARGEKTTYHKACSYLNQLKVSGLRHQKFRQARGFVWTGEKAEGDVVPLHVIPKEDSPF